MAELEDDKKPQNLQQQHTHQRHRRDEEVVDAGGHRVVYKRDHGNKGNNNRLDNIRIHNDGGREGWQHGKRHHGNRDREIVDDGGHRIVYARQHGDGH